MKRQLNFTGRRRLSREVLSVTLVPEPDGELRFDADVRLSDASLPANSPVFVEAYYKRSYMRFDFGTVAQTTPPSERRLTELESTERVMFRLKVAASDGSGKLLAVADGITAEIADSVDDQGRRSILPVNFKSDLGQLIWRVSIDEMFGPELQVNARLVGAREWVRSDPVFSSLVYPAVVGEVLTYIIAEDEVESDAGWRADWIRSATAVAGAPPPREADLERLHEWRDDVVAEFANVYRCRSMVAEAVGGASDDSN